ncbi:MAG: hypothetical protein RI907_3402 [Pseudomonadota bacterium]|jgi:iron complex outermembrane receptor protein
MRRLPFTLAVAATLTPFASPAADGPDDTLPALSVTGTALRLPGRDAALPITTLTRTEIDRSGARTLAELLQRLPAMQGHIPGSAVSGNLTGGYTSLALHNLPDRYTLVLINGQRVAPFGGQTPTGGLASVDANTLPLAMIERIEVLTDGASALYGADALAGVVNLITRRDGDVNEATAGWQQAQGGARTWSLSAYKGQGDLQADGHNLALGASVTRRSALPATARGYASQTRADFMLGGQRVRFDDSSFYSAPANVFAYFGDNQDRSAEARNPALQGAGACPAGHNLVTAPTGRTCGYNYAADTTLVPAQRQHTLMASYTSQVADSQRWMIDALWSRSTVWSQQSPEPVALDLPNTAPYDTLLADLGSYDNTAYTRLTELGPRRRRDTSDLTHLAARAEGRLHGWAWQAGLMQSTSRYDGSVAGLLSRAGANAAVAAGFNPFLTGAQQSANGLSVLRQQAYQGGWLHGTDTLQGLQWQASTDGPSWPAGPMRWAVGADWRQERWRYAPGAYAQGLVTDVASGATGAFDTAQLPLDNLGVALTPMAASRRVWGVFTEALAPLQRQEDRRWDLGASLRHDRDDQAGQALTAKVHTRWQPSAQWLWRASAGTGFRTPSLGQLRAPLQAQGSSGYQLCTAELQAMATQLGATPCTADQYTTFALAATGNSALRPERSQQASVGLRIEPLVGHSIGLDWWAVRVTRQIGTIGADTVFAQPQRFAQAWQVGPDGQLMLVSAPQNLGTNATTGIDLDARVLRGSAIGVFDSQLRLTTLLRDSYQPYPGANSFDAIGDGFMGAPSLRWRAQWRTTWVRAAWSHSLTARYQSGWLAKPVQLTLLDDNGQPQQTTDDYGTAVNRTITWRQKVPGTWRFDWQTRWQLHAHVQLALGIDNVFNRRPPSALAADMPYKANIVGYDDRFHDALGRVWSLQARVNF